MKIRILLIITFIINYSFTSAQNYANIPFHDDFETAELSNHWEANPDLTHNGVVEVANDWGVSGSHGLRFGKTTDGGGTAFNYADLLLDLSTVADSQLVFNFLMNDYADENHIEDAVLFSDDGGITFVSVIQLYPENWGGWAPVRAYDYDLDELLEQHQLNPSANFVIRFQQYDNADFNNSGDEDGIMIDNVSIGIEKPIVYAPVPYFQDFESSDNLQADYHEWHTNSDDVGGKTADANVLNRYARIQVLNDWGVSNSYGLIMGKYSDGEGNNLNAIDLHVNLSTVVDSQLIFNFLINDYTDETHIDDGVYFSDNGGESFEKITEINFYPDNWSGWAPVRPYDYDLDELLEKYELNPSTNFVIRFQQFDNADFSNSGDEDGIMIDNVNIGIEKPVVYAPVPYFQDFESSDDISNDYHEWHINSDEVKDKTADENVLNRYARIQVLNDWGVSNSYGLIMGKYSDGEGNNLNAIDLHVDMSMVADSQWIFNFLINDYVDETHIEDGVYFSDNGGESFEKIEEIDFHPENWGGWAPIRPYDYDLDELLEQYELTPSPNFVIRFQQFDNADFSNSGDEDGIMIDHVNIAYEKAVEYAAIPYYQDFESSANLQTDYTEWHINSDEVGGKTADVNVLNRYARIQVLNDWGIGSSYGLILGKYSDGEGNNLNAIDLHLNLEGYDDEQLIFNFEINDYADETHIEDGVYFSDDGGITFEKIEEVDFTPEIWGGWAPIRRYNFDLDELINNAELSFSDKFVIRFQQFDDADFSNSGDEDGIMIDNVIIDFDKIPIYQTLPFCDNFFESCISSTNCPFNNAWYINNADALFGDDPTCFDTNSLSRYTRVGIANGTSSDGDNYSIYMGKYSDSEGFNTNALDLHLNLEGHQNNEVLLTLYLDSYADETHIEDAIFASSNGGLTWEKIHSIQPASLPNAGFNYIEINLSDKINNATSLSFTPNFVVRFQQYDNADFGLSGDEDGFIIDDVQVYSNGFTCQIVDVEEVDNESNITITPNPTTAQITIQHPKTATPTQVHVVDLNGRHLSTTQSTTGELQLDLSTLPEGIYFVHLVNEKYNVVRKVLKSGR